MKQKKINKYILFFVLTSIVIIAGGCSEDDGPLGACLLNGGLSCANDKTQSECQFVLGSFREGKTCQDFGFSSN